MKKDLIAASILSADFASLADQIHQCENAGVDWIHIDVMDGHFVPNISMGPFVVETCRRITSLPLDVHLMIDNPEEYVETFAKAGADVISVHVEGIAHVQKTLQEIRRMNCRAGIVLNPGTSPLLIEYLLPFIDMILVMTVNPGFSGQKFIPEVIQKIGTLRQLCQKWNVDPDIEVDGGITINTAPIAKAAGANIFVAATAIFKTGGGIQSAVQDLKLSLK